MRLKRLLVWGALAAPVIWAAAGPAPRPRMVFAQTNYDDAINSRQRELEDLKRQAAEKRQKAREFAKREKGVLARLNRAEEAIVATRDYLDRLQDRQMDLEIQIRRSEADLEHAEAVLAQRKQDLGKRLRYSYMYGKARALEVVFSADTFADLLQRGAFLNRVLQEDKRLIAEVEEREAEVQHQLDRLHQKQDELARLKSEKEDQRRQYEALKAQRGRDLAKVRDQKQENEQAARELEAAAAKMKKVLAELERKRRDAMSRHSPVLAELDRNDFGKNRGRLPWPVQGKVIDAFGRHEHPKYHTITLNNGVDVAADIGTPVISVGDGVVDLVQWLPGYGQTVIVNHGRGFYTIYAHLSAVSVAQGARVAPGQTLGAVGDTGSLKGPCLHFEVRNGGSAENPALWLR
jgi:septal ring factor EnvC (AmiA/AmiB activator)